MSTGAPNPDVTDAIGGSPASQYRSGTTFERLRDHLRDRYVVEREIGRGGASHVYLGRDLKNDTRVAIKVLRPELVAPTGEGRFLREIEIVRRLEHPNVLPMLDYGNADGQLYFTMPYVEGETLRQRLKRDRQLKLVDAVAIARDVAEGLDYAHLMGVIHRDIKPANILLEKGRTIVADFGIAKAMVVASGEELTPDSGIVIGTVEYMSPEQGEGHRKLDGRSDVYALGCVVYEMLAGEPPFTGPNAQAVIARHCHEAPRSIRIIRPQVPLGVQRAVEKALAKVPADRFETAGALIVALEEGLESRTDVFGFTRLRRRSRVAISVGLAAVIGIGALYVTNSGTPALDPNRVVVFPLHDPAGAANGDGESVASFVGYALDGTRPLKWRDGWELLDRDQRLARTRLEPGIAQSVSRRHGAGFYIGGSIVRQRDSVTVILRLHDVAGDSLVRTAGRTGAASASVLQLGVDAIGELLVDLVSPGGKIDVSALRERKTQAIANFVQGEREYRRMQFHAALAHYEAALEDDSAFTLAALRGAYAATWLSDFGSAEELVDFAVQRRHMLSLAQGLLARSLSAYLRGAADSALFYGRAALRSDSLVPAGWTVLGEVYSRLLPNEENADSLARDALERARRIDSDFAPTLLLLEEFALRDGDVRRASQLRAELRVVGADTTHAFSRELMHLCMNRGPGAVSWDDAVRRDENAVLSSAKILAGAASQARCALPAFEAILETAGTGRNTRWAAFLGLHALLAAQNRTIDLVGAFSLPGTKDLPRGLVHLMLASQERGFEKLARKTADSAASSSYIGTRAPTLWALGMWETRAGNAGRLREIARQLRSIADSSGTRRDSLMAAAVAARLPLLGGDTSSTIALLRALKPSATRYGLGWEPWESLGPDRLLLSWLLFARRDYVDAMRVASLLDATEPLIYPLYLRSSLEIRIQCADRLGRPELAERFKRRLAQLSIIAS